MKREQYNNATLDEKVQLEEEYKLHTDRKEKARLEKASDKAKASVANSDWHAVTADLQSVLHTPCGNVSTLYYARKLSVYNFTVYDQVSGNGFCFLWNETQGQRGANEIGSILYIYLKEYVKKVKHVIITTDSTVGQNHNQYITCLLLLAAQVLPFETIEQKFLETGHTQMEVDSVHSTIDSHRKT